MELLRELVPHLRRIAVLVNPADANTETQLKAVNEAARAMGLQIQVAIRTPVLRSMPRSKPWVASGPIASWAPPRS